jgi:hypothetical protein
MNEDSITIQRLLNTVAMVGRVGPRRADEHSESFRLRDRDAIFVSTTAPAEFKWEKPAYLEVNEI